MGNPIVKFLKPTKLKILLFLIMVVLFSVMPFTFDALWNRSTYFVLKLFFSFGFLWGFVLVYLFSCLLSFLHKKKASIFWTICLAMLITFIMPPLFFVYKHYIKVNAIGVVKFENVKVEKGLLINLENIRFKHDHQNGVALYNKYIYGYYASPAEKHVKTGRLDSASLQKIMTIIENSGVLGLDQEYDYSIAHMSSPLYSSFYLEIDDKAVKKIEVTYHNEQLPLKPMRELYDELLAYLDGNNDLKEVNRMADCQLLENSDKLLEECIYVNFYKTVSLADCQNIKSQKTKKHCQILGEAKKRNFFTDCNFPYKVYDHDRCYEIYKEVKMPWRVYCGWLGNADNRYSTVECYKHMAYKQEELNVGRALCQELKDKADDADSAVAECLESVENFFSDLSNCQAKVKPLSSSSNVNRVIPIEMDYSESDRCFYDLKNKWSDDRVCGEIVASEHLRGLCYPRD